MVSTGGAELDPVFPDRLDVFMGKEGTNDGVKAM